MNKKISLGAAIAFALIVAAAVFSVSIVYSQNSVNQTLSDLHQREQQDAKYSEIDREIRQRYYGSIDEQELRDSISEGFINGLGDHHAHYYSAEEYALMVEDQTATVASIGTKQKTTNEGYVEITEVYAESPAYLAGIKPGAIITQMDNVKISSSNNEQKMAALKGAEGSQLTLTVQQDGAETFHDLIRRVVEEPTVTWRLIPDTRIAYVRISNFDGEYNTSNQFNRVLTEIQASDGGAIIFDLRDVESYDYKSAARILDRLVPQGLMFSQIYNEDSKEDHNSDANDLIWPMAVIVNSGTSGIGEVFTQVLKDFGLARSVGVTTAGRGVYLEVIPLSDGSAVKLPVALYQTEKGTSLNGEGLHPDFEVSLADVAENEWGKLLPQNDTQLNRAIELVLS